jgi:hypothetical protein
LLDPDKYFTPTAFLEYYAWLSEKEPKLGGSKSDPFKQGLLPFRVWQIFQKLVKFASDGDTVSFVAAAGIVAHYLGDSCQPLHGSVFADGDPRKTKTITHPQLGTTEEVAWAKGVHSAYETAMIDRRKADLFPAIQDLADKQQGKHGLDTYSTGRDAGLATIALMQSTAELIPGAKLCATYEKLGGKSTVAVQDGLYEKYGDETAQVMALGARALACFWESAWKEGRGAAAGHTVAEVDQDALRERYEDRKFLESITLDQIDSELGL